MYNFMSLWLVCMSAHVGGVTAPDPISPNLQLCHTFSQSQMCSSASRPIRIFKTQLEVATKQAPKLDLHCKQSALVWGCEGGGRETPPQLPQISLWQAPRKEQPISADSNPHLSAELQEFICTDSSTPGSSQS